MAEVPPHRHHARHAAIGPPTREVRTCVFLKFSHANGVISKQILSAVNRAARLNCQSKTVRWRIEGGHDDDGAELTVIVKFEGDLIIVVTAF